MSGTITAPQAAGTGYARLVIPIDPTHGSHRSIPAAVQLAQRLRTDVTLLGVNDRHAEVRGLADRLAAQLDDVEVDVTTVPGERPALAIADAVNQVPRSLVCMSSTAVGRFREAALHPVSLLVLRLARRPIALVGPHHQLADRWTRLDAFLDASPASTPQVRETARLASALNAEVNLFNVVAHPAKDITSDVIDDGHLRTHARTLADHHVPVAWDTLYDASPAHAILRHLHHRHDTIAVLGCHGHEGQTHLRHPSVIADVVHRTQALVVAVPADLEVD
jgi:nucleotide-binding universal stress UspA family protein